ncbi:hypothetical protein AABB24_017028 [Solanum stoloniferum]|uniref:Uncharacterized protein n=1 Tax=Solanum stoloniferum TaxID=62892 RepID=A0ABD2TIL7_9SOLN
MQATPYASSSPSRVNKHQLPQLPLQQPPLDLFIRILGGFRLKFCTKNSSSHPWEEKFEFGGVDWNSYSTLTLFDFHPPRIESQFFPIYLNLFISLEKGETKKKKEPIFSDYLISPQKI